MPVRGSFAQPSTVNGYGVLHDAIAKAQREAAKQVEAAKRLEIEGWFEGHGLPSPVFEHKFLDGRNFRLDIAWPDMRVAVEIEGGVFGYVNSRGQKQERGAHGSVKGILRDIEKYSLAAAEGWLVIRRVPKDLLTQGTIDLLKRAFSNAKGPH